MFQNHNETAEKKNLHFSSYFKYTHLWHSYLDKLFDEAGKQYAIILFLFFFFFPLMAPLCMLQFAIFFSL